MSKEVMSEIQSITVDGVAYLLGSAGSLVLCCPQCGEEHFREPRNYFGKPPIGEKSWHRCFSCPACTQMEPIRIDELEIRWKPFWKAIDGRPRPERSKG